MTEPVALSREEVIQALEQAMVGEEAAIAFWEGGSAAWGREDEWSDLDLQLLVTDDAVPHLIEKADVALEALGGVALRFEVPQPTWHGHAQVFYRLRAASDFMLVDLALIKRSSPNRFDERERHGERIVRFDKTGEAASVALDRRQHGTTLRAAFERLKVTFPLFQTLAKKEVLRGNAVAALGFYHTHTLLPLVTLLRMHHCPDRFDFGLKYALYDLPDDVYALVAKLAFARDLQDLTSKQAAAERAFAEALTAIEDGAPTWLDS